MTWRIRCMLGGPCTQCRLQGPANPPTATATFAIASAVAVAVAAAAVIAGCHGLGSAFR